MILNSNVHTHTDNVKRQRQRLILRAHDVFSSSLHFVIESFRCSFWYSLLSVAQHAVKTAASMPEQTNQGETDGQRGIKKHKNKNHLKPTAKCKTANLALVLISRSLCLYFFSLVCANSNCLNSNFFFLLLPSVCILVYVCALKRYLVLFIWQYLTSKHFSVSSTFFFRSTRHFHTLTSLVPVNGFAYRYWNIMYTHIFHSVYPILQHSLGKVNQTVPGAIYFSKFHMIFWTKFF